MRDNGAIGREARMDGEAEDSRETRERKRQAAAEAMALKEHGAGRGDGKEQRGNNRME